MTGLDWELIGGDPAPGDPEAFLSLAADFADTAADAEDAYRSLNRLRHQVDDSIWRGEAAEAFKEQVGGSVTKDLRRLFESYHRAAEGARAYAQTLSELRRSARQILGEAQRAQAEERTAERHREETLATVPGAATTGQDEAVEAARHLLRQAQRRAEELRGEREGAEARLLSALEAASDLGMPNRKWWQKVGGTLGSFADGVWEGASGLASFAWSVSPTRALIDPRAYLEEMTGLAKGLIYGVAHPVEFAKAAANWDMWLEDPARALGQLVPELLLTAATGGAGALSKGVGAARRVAGRADELAGLGRVARSASRVSSGAESAAQGSRLNRHLRQLEKYGPGGFRELESGRLRYYGELDPAANAGEMAGRRLVREWDPATGNIRTWHETLDHSGRVRQVRPETGGPKIHHTFDGGGEYRGSW